MRDWPALLKRLATNRAIDRIRKRLRRRRREEAADVELAADPGDDPAGQAEAAELALYGLAELGDPRALSLVTPLLESPHARLRKAAATALVWVARGDTATSLREALKHADPQVKYRAALGLAYLGDATVAPGITMTTRSATRSDAMSAMCRVPLLTAASFLTTRPSPLRRPRMQQ